MDEEIFTRLVVLNPQIKKLHPYIKHIRITDEEGYYRWYMNYRPETRKELDKFLRHTGLGIDCHMDTTKALSLAVAKGNVADCFFLSINLIRNDNKSSMVKKYDLKDGYGAVLAVSMPLNAYFVNQQEYDDVWQIWSCRVAAIKQGLAPKVQKALRANSYA